MKRIRLAALQPSARPIPGRAARDPGSSPGDAAPVGPSPRANERSDPAGRPSPAAVRRALPVAEALAVERLFLSAASEGLFRTEPPAECGARVALKHAGRNIVLTLEPAPAPAVPRRLLRMEPDTGQVATVESARDLLGLLGENTANIAPETLRAIAEEVDQSILNEALCIAARASWNRSLASAARQAGDAGLTQHLARRLGAARASLALDQWASAGHPRYVLPKIKTGFRVRDVLDYSPEFRPGFPVRLAAVARQSVHVETLDERPPEALLADDLPEWLASWRASLAGQGLDPSDFVPLPLHPWQASRVAPRLFREHLRRGTLRLLDGPGLPCTATSSTRTVAPRTTSRLHLKLSLDARLTSVRRTISARSCEMGPRVTRLLEGVVADDARLARTVALAPELVGIHYVSGPGEDPALERQLAAILRADPARRVGPGEVAVPCTALSLASPIRGLPLLAELAAGGPGSEGESTETGAVLAGYSRYVRILVSGALRLYLVYGIALEAHQQNSFAVFDQDGQLCRFLFRDFGGLRIHEPTLHQRGLSLKVHPDRLTVVQERGPARAKLTHTLFHAHIAVLAEALARHFGVSERALWGPVAEAVDEAFQAAHGEADSEILAAERRALTREPWTTKAFLRMRLQDSAGDLEVATANPLVRWAEEPP